ncbi:Spore germination protein KA [Propionispora sp. 2/2-37]|uniref:spore germination protein n=1 Tax=Propionispora sp. 2/2-37 TaxID=1677858 RepID=UPI0006C6C9C3|nr:spore germination protein [Propionispora sp. 2/2-37]CUH97270.1 Spore germination protein KA [Propionispora sp. 2/2-37]
MTIYKKLIGRLRFLQYLQAKQHSVRLSQSKEPANTHILSTNIKDNETFLKTSLGKSNDVVFREITLGLKSKTKALICFIDGLADKDKINEHIIKSLTIDAHLAIEENNVAQDIFHAVKNSLLTASEIKETRSLNEVLRGILAGDVLLIINGYDSAFIIGMKGWATRAIAEPYTESTIRGPREGFTETLRTNTSMLRRKIKNPNLIFESLTIGQQTHTEINIVYIKGVASESMVAEVKKRLRHIDTDAILESGYIEQYIEDNPFSFFSTIGNSEKPDIVAAKLLEGRVAIFCDGTPFVLTVPLLFIETLQSAEDYYSRPYLATIVRWIRFFAFVITLTAPALYVALETFHQELLPTVLLITAAAAREGIPFPAFLEGMIIGVIFEILRESGIRMPQPVGQAVSIVGALVVGEAAVRAGIISAPMVIIAALTAITGFIVTPLMDAVVPFRFFLLGLAAMFGLYGITIGLILMLGHMCSLRSFGTPYLSPFAPTNKAGLKDALFRAPLWLMHTRPQVITWKTSARQSSSLQPDQDTKEGEHQ